MASDTSGRIHAWGRGYLNRSNAMRAIFLTAVIVVCAVGCGGRSDSYGSPDEMPETWLSEMLRSVPTDMEGAYITRVWVADYEAERAPRPPGYPGSIASWESISAPGGAFLEDARHFDDAIGLDFMDRDRAVWLHGEHFGIHEGKLGDPARIGERLSDIGYERYHHGGVEYYRFAPRFGLAVDKHPQGAILYNLANNIAFIDDRTLITARHTRDLKWIVDVREQVAKSMGDEERWKTLAKAAGDELVRGALIAPEYVLWPFETEDGAIVRLQYWAGENVRNWSRYTEGPDAWGTLEPYTALAMGFTVSSGEPGTLIALYHPDPEAADRNAVELKHRWKTARMDLRRIEIPKGTYKDLTQGEDTPFTEMCAPLEARTLVFDKSSVLLATCPAILREAPFWGAQGFDFYYGLFNYGELHFLVPDLSGLAAAQ